MPKDTANSGTSSQTNQQDEAQDQQDGAQAQQHEAQNQQQAENGSIFVLLILAVMFLGWLLEKDPVYSLQRTSKYVVKRKTRRMSVRYFVERDFLKHSAEEIARIEQQVEEEFHNPFRKTKNK